MEKDVTAIKVELAEGRGEKRNAHYTVVILTPVLTALAVFLLELVKK